MEQQAVSEPAPEDEVKSVPLAMLVHDKHLAAGVVANALVYVSNNFDRYLEEMGEQFTQDTRDILTKDIYDIFIYPHVQAARNLAQHDMVSDVLSGLLGGGKGDVQVGMLPLGALLGGMQEEPGQEPVQEQGKPEGGGYL